MGGGIDETQHNTLVVVSLNWNSDDRKWNANAWNLDENDNWNADNRVFRNFLISLSTDVERVLFLYLSQPTTKHFTYLI